MMYHPLCPMSARRLCVVSLLIGLLLCAGCGPSDPAASTRELVLAFHERILTIDPAWDAGGLNGAKRSSADALDLALMKDGALDAGFFIASVPQGDLEAADGPSWREAMAPLDPVLEMTKAYPDQACLGLAPQDAYRAEKQGLRTVFIGLGSGHVAARDFSVLKDLHDRGVRLMTLFGGRDNPASPATANADDAEGPGLNDIGRRIVAECNRLGIIIDLAGAPQKCFFDVLAASASPVVVSRSGARSLAPRPDNLSDEMLRALAEKGGVVHIRLEPRFLVQESSAGGRRATLDDFMAHVDHVRKLIGTEHIGISTGFGGGGPGVEGCGNAKELANLTVALLRRGYNETEVESIWGGNFMRTFERVVRLAGER